MPKTPIQRREKTLNPNDPKVTPRELVNFIRLRAAPGESSGYNLNTPIAELRSVADSLCKPRFGEGPLQTEQQVTAPSKPRLKLVLRREGNNGDGIPATIPANASQTVGGGDPGPISSPLTSVDGDEGTRANKCGEKKGPISFIATAPRGRALECNKKEQMVSSRGNGPARRKKVKSAATSGRSNFEQLETVASSSKNASNKRCLEEVSSEMAATAGRDIPKRTRLSPKPIDTVHIAPLISPTGIELSPEDLPGQGPMIWFEPDQPLESSSPGMTSSWTPLTPTFRNISTPTNEPVYEAVNRFVEAELEEIESLRLKNCFPVDETLSQTVAQVMKTLEIGLLNSEFQTKKIFNGLWADKFTHQCDECWDQPASGIDLCDTQGVDGFFSERSICSREEPTDVFLEKLIERGLIVRPRPPPPASDAQADLQMGPAKLVTPSSSEKPGMVIGCLESILPVDPLIVLSPPLSTPAGGEYDHSQSDYGVAKHQIIGPTRASASKVAPNPDCKSGSSNASAHRLSLPPSRPPMDEVNAARDEINWDNIEDNQRTDPYKDFFEDVYKHAYEAYCNAKPSGRQNGPSSSATGIFKIHPPVSATFKPLSSALPMDLDIESSVQSASASFVPMDLGSNRSIGPESSALASFPSSDPDIKSGKVSNLNDHPWV
ncbi:hypothetical protein PTTG_29478 [Puccinia triticina 1-1 BBBD Race 1]|uniref:Uncharacterized protein n=2 Tax=Puccinia triticina TaxID=208348 RepID=A0A180G3Z3_PUCT1|nr:uncharacterized protein PtA15_4A34 [Puccinia triticina]OAV87320.1 hypothetical protein PTTG_29478 [Puccinia triticina 1-1 BBBD Race 1]WAQ83586.1 hypothetical protein PtA15_4A34 [Puccinia triticina]